MDMAQTDRGPTNQTINSTGSARNYRRTQRNQTTFLRRKFSTILKLKVFFNDKEGNNLDEFRDKIKTLLRVLQQEDELIFLARYWVSHNDTEAGKLTTPGTALADPLRYPRG